MADADVNVAELEAAVDAASGADEPNSTERPPSRREDLMDNAFFDVERGVCVWGVGAFVRGVLVACSQGKVRAK